MYPADQVSPSDSRLAVGSSQQAQASLVAHEAPVVLEPLSQWPAGVHESVPSSAVLHEESLDGGYKLWNLVNRHLNNHHGMSTY